RLQGPAPSAGDAESDRCRTSRDNAHHQFSKVLTMKSKLTKISLAAAIAAASFGMSQAQAADYTFSFAHVLIEETPNGQAALRFKEGVEEKSEGRIQI